MLELEEEINIKDWKNLTINKKPKKNTIIFV